MMTDLVHDAFGQTTHPLDAFFAPKQVALIGATENPGSVGRTLLRNLIATPFGGVVYPVNPKRASVLGIKAYPTMADLPTEIDLAIIVTPSKSVPELVRECVTAKVKAVIVISAGFKELGAPGIALENELREALCNSGLRLIGPNCLGVMSPVTGLNATFAKGCAEPGKIAFLSQSGALLTAVLDWGAKEKVGFRACVSLGSMLDVSWGDLIDYFGNDPDTDSILIYMESIGDARAFLSAARKVSLSKPIILIKAGRTAAAATAAASHTGAMTGSDEVLDAAFERAGVLRVNTISELFDMAGALAKQPRPKGPRLTILTNAGGPAVLATDCLIQSGGSLATLSPLTESALSTFLPAAWSHHNPIDILGDANAERYARTIKEVVKETDSDGLLIVLTPQDMTEATATAKQLLEYGKIGKPLLASWMGGNEVAEGIDLLNRAGIPTFSSPDMAARAFSYMWRYSDNLKSIYETPTSQEEPNLNDKTRIEALQLIEQAYAKQERLLSEYESKKLLALYGLPVTPIALAATTAEALLAAKEIGYPVVVKLHSTSLTHKTDVGGVKLNLTTPEAVEKAFLEIQESLKNLGKSEHFEGVSLQPMIILKDSYELIIGSSCDPQFGPVLMFGYGGQLVEVFKDYRLALPPINTTLAKRMMEKTKIYQALQGIRGRPPIKMELLEQLLVRFSQLVVEQPHIAEIEINPLLVNAETMLILDARIHLHPLSLSKLPEPAIRPYPLQYIESTELKDGQKITARPIRPEDEPLVVQFHQALSERSIHLRYFTPMPLSERTTHERMVRLCCADYEQEITLIVQRLDSSGSTKEIIAIGRLSRCSGTSQARFTLLISDQWQNKGLGSWLLRKLLHVAKAEKIERVTATLQMKNVEMAAIVKKLGFQLTASSDGKSQIASYPLKQE